MDIGKVFTEAARRCWRLFTPDMSREERRELASSQTWQAQERDRIVALAQRQQAQLLAEQRHIEKQMAGREHKAVDGLGELYGSIPEKVYLQMRIDHGDDCWSDPGFIEAFFRDNPGLRAKTKYGTHGQEYVTAGGKRRGLIASTPFTRNGAIRG